MINTGYITRDGREVIITDSPRGKKMVILRDPKKGKISGARKAPGSRMGTLEQALKFVAYKALNGDFIPCQRRGNEE